MTLAELRSIFRMGSSMGTADVDTNGNLFIGGEDLVGTQFWCIRSSNAQIGSQTPVFEQVTQVNLGGVRVWRECKSGRADSADIPGSGSFGRPYEQQRLHAVQCSAAKL